MIDNLIKAKIEQFEVQFDEQLSPERKASLMEAIREDYSDEIFDIEDITIEDIAEIAVASEI